jgi:hypothetical protein
MAQHSNEPESSASTRFQPSTVVRRAERLASCDLAGEAVILNLDSGVYFGLADSGARIWELLSAPTSVADLRDAVVAEFEVDAETCLRDLRTLLTQLLDAGLVLVSDEPGR